MLARCLNSLVMASLSHFAGFDCFVFGALFLGRLCQLLRLNLAGFWHFLGRFCRFGLGDFVASNFLLDCRFLGCFELLCFANFRFHRHLGANLSLFRLNFRPLERFGLNLALLNLRYLWHFGRFYRLNLACFHHLGFARGFLFLCFRHLTRANLCLNLR